MIGSPLDPPFFDPAEELAYELEALTQEEIDFYPIIETVQKPDALAWLFVDDSLEDVA